MEISFDNERTKKLLESEKALKRSFGARVARAVMKRLALLRAANNLFDLHQIRSLGLHELERERSGQFAVNVEEGKRLIFVPDHAPVPAREDGRADWAGIKRVTVLEIVDYHD